MTLTTLIMINVALGAAVVAALVTFLGRAIRADRLQVRRSLQAVVAREAHDVERLAA
jgi:hypothetical protein